MIILDCAHLQRLPGSHTDGQTKSKIKQKGHSTFLSLSLAFSPFLCFPFVALVLVLGESVHIKSGLRLIVLPLFFHVLVGLDKQFDYVYSINK